MNETAAVPNSEGQESQPARRLSVVPTPSKVTDLSKRRRAVDLATLTDLRREMSRVYRSVHKGTLTAEEGTKRVYMLREISKVAELADTQPRVEAIERALNRRTP